MGYTDSRVFIDIIQIKVYNVISLKLIANSFLSFY